VDLPTFVFGSQIEGKVVGGELALHGRIRHLLLTLFAESLKIGLAVRIK
jgi:hypothetical protein